MNPPQPSSANGPSLSEPGLQHVQLSNGAVPFAGNELVVARQSADVLVLIITIIVVFLGFILSGQVLDLGFIIGFLFIVGIILFYIRLYQINFLGNALRVQSGKHAYLLEAVQEISHNLEMPKVDVFIAQDPYLNAFAVGYHHPYTIVLHSAIVDELSPDELKAILVHEMGHIKYRHTIITAYLQPMSLLVPVLGPIISWVFGFWSRRAELACDRLAVSYMKNPHIVANALMKVHVGSKFAGYMTEEGVFQQDVQNKGLMRLMSQSLATHPFLVTRVREIMEFAQRIGIRL